MDGRNGSDELLRSNIVEELVQGLGCFDEATGFLIVIRMIEKETAMEPTMERERRTVDELRRGFYGFLASIYQFEPTAEQIESMAAQRFPLDDPDLGSGYALIAEYLRHRDSGTRQELAVDYAHVFLGAGQYDKRMAPPYESVYTSAEHLLMQDSRDGVVQSYRAEGLDLPAENTTPEDHISFEMQFMAKLIERADAALGDGDETRYKDLIGKQRVFYEEHLQNWVGSFCDDIERLCHTDFYRGIAQVTRGFMRMEDDFTGRFASAA